MLHTLTVRESPVNERISELLVGQHDLRALNLEHNPGDNWMAGFDSDFRGIQSGVTMEALRRLTEDRDLKAFRHLTISVAPKQLKAVKELLTARFVHAEECGLGKARELSYLCKPRPVFPATSGYGDLVLRLWEAPTTNQISRKAATILTSLSGVTPPNIPEPNGYERLMQPFVDQGLRVTVEVRSRHYEGHSECGATNPPMFGGVRILAKKYNKGKSTPYPLGYMCLRVFRNTLSWAWTQDEWVVAACLVALVFGFDIVPAF
ncbi:hypothetical protein BDZ89DRAFT_1117582 [Hymenopellis radicata]|nr:hypothetical protein BDZ89DRAFT_1117582 [Hymenopellis radicata]